MSLFGETVRSEDCNLTCLIFLVLPRIAAIRFEASKRICLGLICFLFFGKRSLWRMALALANAGHLKYSMSLFDGNIFFMLRYFPLESYKNTACVELTELAMAGGKGFVVH